MAVVVAGCSSQASDSNTEPSSTEPTSTEPTITEPTSTIATAATSSAAPVTVNYVLVPDTTVTVRPGVDPNGSSTEATLNVDGVERSYRLYVPSTLPDGENVALLVALHGGGGSGAQFEQTSEFDHLAEANGFIVAYPDGTAIGTTNGHVWNAGNCCGRSQQNRDNVDDVGFIAALLSELERSQPVDPTRVFFTGHSNGAMMSFRLACELSTEIAAIAVQSGPLGVDACDLDHPMSVLEIHGTDDSNVPIDGGLGSGVSNTDFASPQASVQRLADLAGCRGPEDSVAPDNATVTYRVWSGCSDDVRVQMTIVEGAHHAWMGHDPPPRERAPDQSAADENFDSSLAVWAFLANHG